MRTASKIFKITLTSDLLPKTTCPIPFYLASASVKTTIKPTLILKSYAVFLLPCLMSPIPFYPICTFHNTTLPSLLASVYFRLSQRCFKILLFIMQICNYPMLSTYLSPAPPHLVKYIKHLPLLVRLQPSPPHLPPNPLVTILSSIQSTPYRPCPSLSLILRNHPCPPFLLSLSSFCFSYFVFLFRFIFIYLFICSASKIISL